MLNFFLKLIQDLLYNGAAKKEKVVDTYSNNVVKLQPSTAKSMRQDSAQSTPKFFFAKRSRDRLKKAHPDLQALAHAILEEMDIAVICTYRGEAEQNAAFASGHSKLKYPQSKHNVIPSRAIDIVPVPLDWSNIPAFEAMCKIAERKAAKLGIRIRLGRDFSFKDFVHFELI